MKQKKNAMAANSLKAAKKVHWWKEYSRWLYLESRDPGEDQVSERLAHRHACPCCRGDQPFDWLLSDRCGGTLQTKRRQCDHGDISQWGVEGSDALLLSNQPRHRTIHLGEDRRPNSTFIIIQPQFHIPVSLL